MLDTFTRQRDAAEAGIERLQGELVAAKQAQMVGIVLTLKRFIPQVQQLLCKIEWEGHETFHQCPACKQSRMHGHSKDCQLKAVLDEIQ